MAYNCHDNNKRNTVNKENLIDKNVLLTYKKVCFHINKISSHIQKEFAYKYKKPTANSHDKFSQLIPAANSCGK